MANLLDTLKYILLLSSAIDNGTNVTQRFTSGKLRSDMGSRIIGGQDVSIAQFPFEIALLYLDNFDCCGSLINERHAVTAGHCTYNRMPWDLKVRAGSSYYFAGGILVNVARKLEHPYYNPNTLDYDVSVLRLQYALPYGKTIQPVALPAYMEPIKTEYAIVSGWGRMADDNFSPFLKALVVKLISYETCVLYKATIFIGRSKICSLPGNQPYKGDSGGPLTIGGKLIGIVSGGSYFIRQLKHPSHYVDVARVVDFIRRAVNA